MSEMLTDLLQNIYGRISQLGKSIQSLQGSLDNLNKTLGDKVSELVDSIKSMSNSVEKEGDEVKLIFSAIGDGAIQEIQKLQEKIGLKDLDELMEKLNKIVESSEEALRPETVDVVLHEVLLAVKQLKEGAVCSESDQSEEELLDKAGSNLVQSPPSSNPTPAPAAPKPGLNDLGPPPGSGPRGPPGNPPPQ